MGKFENHTCRIIGCQVCLPERQIVLRREVEVGFREVATIGSIDSYLGKKADQNCYHSASDKDGNNLHSDSGSIQRTDQAVLSSQSQLSKDSRCRVEAEDTSY